jgi:hypothetical protein
MYSVLSPTDFNEKMHGHSLEPQFTDKYHTFPNPWNSTVAKEFNNPFFLMEDLNRNTYE